MFLNPNESTKEKMDTVAELINLHTNTLDYIEKNERALFNSISIMKNSGSVKTFKCFRVHHKNL